MDVDVEAGLTVIVFGLIGVVFAALVNEFNTRGIIVDEMITGSITISNVMTIIIIFWVVLGLIVAMRR